MFKVKNYKSENSGKPKYTGGTGNFKPPQLQSSNGGNTVSALSLDESANCDNPFSKFIFPGEVILDGQTYNIKVLRDTAAAQTILSAHSVPNLDKKYSGKYITVKCLSGRHTLPLAQIYFRTDLVDGNFGVAVFDSPLPAEGVDMLLGNDLASDLVFPHSLVNSALNSTVHDTKYSAPSCAVTLSQSTSENDSLDVGVPITRSNLIKAQSEDPTLRDYFDKVEDTVVKSTGFCLDGGILVRSYCPEDVGAQDEWAVIKQIVVPQPYRNFVIDMAHNKFIGHLGCRKTSDKILRCFFWPSLRKDVAKFIKTCKICQLGGKPNQVIPKAPLCLIPIVEEPFQRIILDCVGPLPETKKRNRYLLTIMCASTRYPIVFPLRNIRAKTIVDNLIKVFTLYGLPKIIQSD